MKSAEIHQLLNQNLITLIDVRDASDQLSGVARGAVCVSASSLHEIIKPISQHSQPIVLMCKRGNQTISLCQKLGANFISAAGGYEAWLDAGLPTNTPTLSDAQIRYQQQIKLNGFGQAAQDKLLSSHVLVVGAGGLGAPALLYLTACGVGKLSLIDDDDVTLSNLHRQIIFQEQDVGLSKVAQAAIKLRQLNSTSTINPICARLDETNVDTIFSQVNVIIDGSDNIETRYLINQHAIKHSIPWVYAAVTAFDIQVAVFGHHVNELCYECLFPNLENAISDNCQTEGILGPVPGMAAMLQVTEAIKLITGMGTTLRHKMLTYNLLNHDFKMLKYPLNKKCPHR